MYPRPYQRQTPFSGFGQARYATRPPSYDPFARPIPVLPDYAFANPIATRPATQRGVGNDKLAKQVQALATEVARLRVDVKKAAKPPKPVQAKKAQKKEKPKPVKAVRKQRPPKAQRLNIAVERDSVLPVLAGTDVVGHAVVLDGRVFKPRHVRGVVEYNGQPITGFVKAKQLDLEVAPAPRALLEHQAKHAVFKPGSVYKWHRGTVETAQGRFTSVNGRKGDSGRPITDNDGNVVAIVLGGITDTSDASVLKVIVWDSAGEARLVDVENAEDWSAAVCAVVIASAVLLAGALDCPATVEEKLDVLARHVDRPDYWKLAMYVASCGLRTRRAARDEVASVEKDLLTIHVLSEPYTAFCGVCDDRPCSSPVAIEEATMLEHDGTVKVRLSAQMGVSFVGLPLPGGTRIRNLDGSVSGVDVLPEFFTNGGGCVLHSAHGHVALLSCPWGSWLRVALRLAGEVHTCTSPMTVVPHGGPAFERGGYPHKDGLEHDCERFVDKVDVKHMTGLVAHGESWHFSEVNNSEVTLSADRTALKIRPKKCVIVRAFCQKEVLVNVTACANLSYTCDSGYKHVTSLRWSAKLMAASAGRAPVGANMSKIIMLPRAYPVESGRCRSSMAAQPKVIRGRDAVIFLGYTAHEVYLSVSPDPSGVSRWYAGAYNITVPVDEEGVVTRWGNRPPIRYWATSVPRYSPNGDLWEQVRYVWERQNTLALVAAFSALTAAASTMFIVVLLWCVARAQVRGRYAAGFARIPACAACLCCLPQVRGAVISDWAAASVEFSPFTLATFAVGITLGLCLSCLRKCLFPCCLAACLMLPGRALAYEHTAVLSLSVADTPYTATVVRDGYLPVSLTMSVVEAVTTPSFEVLYKTCAFRTVVASPSVVCCGGQTCDLNPDASAFHDIPVAERTCAVFRGVYPFIWGAAQCFCENENTQMSVAATSLAESCVASYAETLRVVNVALRVRIRVRVGNATAEITVGTGASASHASAAWSVVVGQPSTLYSPFGERLVRQAGELYASEFPPFGAPRRGALGDVQFRASDRSDLVADTGLSLVLPGNDAVHVPYTVVSSGYETWVADRGSPLSATSAHGCVIVGGLAYNCSVGNVPVSIDLGEAHFTRVADTPALTELECSVSACVAGGHEPSTLALTALSNMDGRCGIIPLTNATSLSDAIEVRSGKHTYALKFLTGVVQGAISMSACGFAFTCDAKCDLPPAHVVSHREGSVSVSYPWLPKQLSDYGAFSLAGVAAIVVVAVLLFAAVRCCENGAARYAGFKLVPAQA